MKILLTLFMNFILNQPTIKAVKNDLAIFNEGIMNSVNTIINVSYDKYYTCWMLFRSAIIIFITK
jgi:hypothetical protein